MGNGSIAKNVHVGECVGIRLVVDRPQKWKIDSMNDCLKKRSLNFGQATRTVNDRNE